MPTAEARLAFAQALTYAVEWALDETGEADKAYLTGCQETAGHLLACYLTQHGGHECCETAVGRDLIPWGDLPKTVGEWEAFLKKQEMTTYRVTIIRRYERSYDVRASSEDQAEMLVLESPDDGCIHEEMLDDEVTNCEEI